MERKLYEIQLKSNVMIIALKPGDNITPTRIIQPLRVANWKFASECGDVLGGLTAGTRMRVVEISTTPGNMWVKAELPGRHPAAYLKIAGEEFAHNFIKVS